MYTMAEDDYLLELVRSIKDDVSRLNMKQDQQTRKLEKIEVQTIKTNGRVTALERAVEVLQRAKAGLKVPQLSDKALTFLALTAAALALMGAKLLGVDADLLK